MALTFNMNNIKDTVLYHLLIWALYILHLIKPHYKAIHLSTEH